jgi:hypothetical protein
MRHSGVLQDIKNNSFAEIVAIKHKLTLSIERLEKAVRKNDCDAIRTEIRIQKELLR